LHDGLCVDICNEVTTATSSLPQQEAEDHDEDEKSNEPLVIVIAPRANNLCSAISGKGACSRWNRENRFDFVARLNALSRSRDFDES
jgi:hypothetical protein